MHTAEYIRLGHPDKLCDLMGDAVLDAYLAKDPLSRVAVEIQGGHGKVIVTGEVTSAAQIDIAQIIRRVYQDIGYSDPLEVVLNLVPQSRDIAAGVDTGGAGDQGITIGYATPETPEMLPKELVLARKICFALDEAMHTSSPFLGPDGKAQVTLDENGNVHTVVASVQHAPDTSQEKIHELLADIVKNTAGPGKYATFFNPGGAFIQGGFGADTGSTGRKIVCDQYGPRVCVGGGAFSGKDPTKVDRSGAYFARFRARQIAKKTGKEALVEYAWAIGHPRPVAVVGDSMTPTVAQIIQTLDLRRPIYFEAARGGHFGVAGMPWEA